MKNVGYLTNHRDGLSGEKGLYFTYILASNGLFIEAKNPSIAARVLVAECEVRGLAPMEKRVSLTHGKIPKHFFDLALDTFLADPDNEHYVAVTGGSGYRFYVPVQDRGGGSVVYEVGESVVLDLHSHGHMGAFFSGQDDQDEKGLMLYAVVGELNATPVVNLRIGVYGYFNTLSWEDVFDGSLTGAIGFEEKEVITEGDLYHISRTSAPELQHHSRRMRRHGGFPCGGLMPPIEW